MTLHPPVRTSPNGILLPALLSLLLLSVSNPAAADNLIDINTADAEELQQLPGIGPVLSQRIVRDREANGPFASPENITRVFGFGSKKYEAIKDLIRASRTDGRFFRRTKPPGININTATQLELESLPGIGSTKALRIIEYREKQGGFKRTEELMEVWGIGPKTYESLKNLITVQSSRSPTRSRKSSSPAGSRGLKCWRCGYMFTVTGDKTSGNCPSCGAKWKAK